MSKVTFSSRALVYFRIRGEKQAVQPGDELPRARDDGGLVGRFNTWISETKTYPIESHTSGGGVWIGGFDSADAEAVREWLLNEGAERVQEQ